MTLILIVLLVLILAGGTGWGYQQGWYGSPVLIVLLVVLAVLALSGGRLGFY